MVQHTYLKRCDCDNCHLSKLLQYRENCKILPYMCLKDTRISQRLSGSLENNLLRTALLNSNWHKNNNYKLIQQHLEHFHFAVMQQQFRTQTIPNHALTYSARIISCDYPGCIGFCYGAEIDIDSLEIISDNDDGYKLAITLSSSKPLEINTEVDNSMELISEDSVDENNYVENEEIPVDDPAKLIIMMIPRIAIEKIIANVLHLCVQYITMTLMLRCYYDPATSVMTKIR